MTMRIITKVLRQTAVAWLASNDGHGGYSYGTPFEVRCRWEDLQERFVDLDGNEQVSRAYVMVDTDLTVGHFLMLGTLNDLDSGDDPGTLRGRAWQVRSFGKTPTIKADQFLREVWL